MDAESFWNIIESHLDVEDVDDRADAIAESLCDLDGPDIVEFGKIMDGYLAQSYSWDLWGAAYIINGGCSDDGFDYFRGWLILQGSRTFKAAINAPDSLADSDIDEEVECEAALYMAMHAYEKVTGDKLPQSAVEYPDIEDGAWDFDDEDEMSKRYPQLFAKHWVD